MNSGTTLLTYSMNLHKKLGNFTSILQKLFSTEPDENVELVCTPGCTIPHNSQPPLFSQ